MSIFGSTFKPYVINQLETRQALLADGMDSPKRSHNVQLYTGGKTAWVKLQSFVDYADKEGDKPTDTLARQYVLSAGTLLPDAEDSNKFSMRYGIANANGAYGSNLGNNQKGSRQLGLRPMPGITSVNVTNKGAYGSLRLTTIKFKAWDKAQLDDLEILYMRTGYPVLIEWGWSLYMDTSDKEDKDYNAPANRGHLKLNTDTINKLISKPIKSFDDPTINAFDPKLNQDDLYEKIKELSHKFSGNYDGMMGIVQNFTWELMPNGSYDCTTILVSIGDTLDSIKMNRPSQSNKDGNASGYKTNFTQLMSDLLRNNISSSASKGVIDDMRKQVLAPFYTPPTFTDAVTGANEVEVLSRLTKYNGDLFNVDTRISSIEGLNKNITPASSNSMENKEYAYIQLAYFIAVLREGFNLFTEKGAPLLNLELPVHDSLGKYNNRGNGLCLASVDSVSIDPSVCLIKNTQATWITDNEYGFDIGHSIQDPSRIANEYLVKAETSYNSSLGVIGNIYLNVQYVSGVFNDMLSNSKNGEIHLYSFIKTVMDGVSKSLGSINDFDIFVEDNRAIIIDKHYTELSSETNKDNKFTLNIFGTNTTVRGFKILSKIFQSQASMIAISAGTSRTNLGGVNSSTQSYFNKGIKNRLIGETSTNDQTDSSADEIRKEKEELAKGLLSLRVYLKGILASDLASRVLMTATEPIVYANTVLNSVILNVNVDANYKSIIPLAVEITLDGIAGITIGEIFKLNTDMLPKEYNRKYLGFMVTKLSHNIIKSDWTTTLEAYPVLLDQTSQNASSISLSKKQKEDLQSLVQDIARKYTDQQQAYVDKYVDFLYFIKYYYANSIQLSFTLVNNKAAESVKNNTTYLANKADYNIQLDNLSGAPRTDISRVSVLLSEADQHLSQIVSYEKSPLVDYIWHNSKETGERSYNNQRSVPLLNPLILTGDLQVIKNMLFTLVHASEDFKTLQKETPVLAQDIDNTINVIINNIGVKSSDNIYSKTSDTTRVHPLMYDVNSPYGSPSFKDRNTNISIDIAYKNSQK